MSACPQCSLLVAPAALAPGADRRGAGTSEIADEILSILNQNLQRHTKVKEFRDELEEAKRQSTADSTALRHARGGEAHVLILNNEVAFRLTQGRHEAHFPEPSLQLCPDYLLLDQESQKPLILTKDGKSLEVWEAYDSDLVTWVEGHTSEKTRALGREHSLRVGEQLLRLCQKLASFLVNKKEHWWDLRFANLVIKVHPKTTSTQERVDMRVIDLDTGQFHRDILFYNLLQTTFPSS